MRSIYCNMSHTTVSRKRELKSFHSKIILVKVHHINKNTYICIYIYVYILGDLNHYRKQKLTFSAICRFGEIHVKVCQIWSWWCKFWSESKNLGMMRGRRNWMPYISKREHSLILCLFALFWSVLFCSWWWWLSLFNLLTNANSY